MFTLKKIRNLFHRADLDREIDEELESHIAMRVADNIASGMPPDQARHDALLKFGNRAAMKEKVAGIGDAPHIVGLLQSDFGPVNRA